MNQTDVRTFKAATMQEALDIVRRELGPEAVILHTREIPQPRFLKWRKRAERVEVTAGTGVNIRPPRAREQSPAGRSAGSASPSATPPRLSYRQAEESLAPPPPLPLSATRGSAGAASPRQRHAHVPSRRRWEPRRERTPTPGGSNRATPHCMIGFRVARARRLRLRRRLPVLLRRGPP